MKKSFEQFRADFEYLTALIRNAHSQAREGQIVKLGSIEDDVKNLCAEVKSTPAQTARDLQPLMAELIGALDELADALSTFKSRT